MYHLFKGQLVPEFKRAGRKRERGFLRRVFEFRYIAAILGCTGRFPRVYIYSYPELAPIYNFKTEILGIKCIYSTLF